jgi:hypothetical protein
VVLRMPSVLIAKVDAWASTNEASRSEAIRRLVKVGLGTKPAAKTVARPGRRSRAGDLAQRAVEKIVDPAASPEERSRRQRRLAKGPEEFRANRLDQPKDKG